MAMAPLPLAKLGSLLIKTLAKPVAKNIKSQAVKNNTTRKALVWVGQSSHVLTTRMTIWSSGYKVRSISKIDDDTALSQGADILSESVIFGVSVCLLAFEYNRSSDKERRKEETRHKQIQDDSARLQAKLDSLDKRLVALEKYVENKSLLGGAYERPSGVVAINENDAVANANDAVANDADAKDDPPHLRQQRRSWLWFYKTKR